MWWWTGVLWWFTEVHWGLQQVTWPLTETEAITRRRMSVMFSVDYQKQSSAQEKRNGPVSYRHSLTEESWWWWEWSLDVKLSMDVENLLRRSSWIIEGFVIVKCTVFSSLTFLILGCILFLFWKSITMSVSWTNWTCHTEQRKIDTRSEDDMSDWEIMCDTAAETNTFSSFSNTHSSILDKRVQIDVFHE